MEWFTKQDKCYFLCKVSTQSAFASVWGRGCFLHIFGLSLHVIVVLVLDSTLNFSKFPECWSGFPYQYSKGSQTKGFFLYAPQCLMITLSSQWIPSISHMALTPCWTRPSQQTSDWPSCFPGPQNRATHDRRAIKTLKRQKPKAAKC